eukprot:CAMPEP_0117773630 /NCGR_PEP_ID=MMETSP0947-20121206/25966_1 /TAXON_ID=44440 /ORGANISM="Chattonella subsalsa, Strain CCMP2191" /LENGTH=157 /DNA_ID=CAMNT_0005599801 /DNA_START=331 /DNA_END=801 /DNA_ORIENTATION=+
MTVRVRIISISDKKVEAHAVLRHFVHREAWAQAVPLLVLPWAGGLLASSWVGPHQGQVDPLAWGVPLLPCLEEEGGLPFEAEGGHRSRRGVEGACPAEEHSSVDHYLGEVLRGEGGRGLGVAVRGWPCTRWGASSWCARAGWGGQHPWARYAWWAPW